MKFKRTKLVEKELDLLTDKQLLLALERTRLSNERTFLAWIRTSIACIGGGVAIIRLINFNTEPHKIIAQISGDGLIVIGILFLIFSLINYRNLKNQIPEIPGYTGSSSIFVTIIAIALTVLGAILLIIV